MEKYTDYILAFLTVAVTVGWYYIGIADQDLLQTKITGGCVGLLTGALLIICTYRKLIKITD